MNRQYYIPYEVSFSCLNIGDLFTTSTGEWIVWDKGHKTLLAYKNDNTPKSDVTDHIIIFYCYDFPLDKM